MVSKKTLLVILAIPIILLVVLFVFGGLLMGSMMGGSEEIENLKIEFVSAEVFCEEVFSYESDETSLEPQVCFTLKLENPSEEMIPFFYEKVEVISSDKVKSEAKIWYGDYSDELEPYSENVETRKYCALGVNLESDDYSVVFSSLDYWTNAETVLFEKTISSSEAFSTKSKQEIIEECG